MLVWTLELRDWHVGVEALNICVEGLLTVSLGQFLCIFIVNVKSEGNNFVGVN